jgi:hypothetical protein
LAVSARLVRPGVLTDITVGSPTLPNSSRSHDVLTFRASIAVKMGCLVLLQHHFRQEVARPIDGVRGRGV